MSNQKAIEFAESARKIWERGDGLKVTVKRPDNGEWAQRCAYPDDGEFVYWSIESTRGLEASRSPWTDVVVWAQGMIRMGWEIDAIESTGKLGYDAKAEGGE
tara:strand:+ start:36 stop:341 length:306 start_codon:yes stop_codon:yes gene_type:complete